MDELITLVNSKDEVLGYEEKMHVHIEGKLHRAFSLFIIDKTNRSILIQKRAINKYHSGGLWTNACCSHQKKDERVWESVCRRVNDELGIELPSSEYYRGHLYECEKFTYLKKFETCIEYEVDHVFIWNVDGSKLKLNPNKDEIEKLLWVDISDLYDWIEKAPQDFTSWFFPAFEIAVHYWFGNPALKCSLFSGKLNEIIQEKTREVLVCKN